MAGGWFHTLLLRSDGQAAAFGRDDQGSFKYEVLAPADGSRYVEAACGLYHSVLLCENGVAVACGSNSIGQCDVPELPAGVAYISAAASEHHTALLRSDGLAEVFGNNFWGQCSVPALDNKTSYTGVSVGLRHTVLLRSDGQAVAVGQKDGGCCDVPGLPPGLAYKAVAAGGGHTVLLRSDGQALAFGRNNCGQTDVPPLPDGLRYVATSAGGTHTVLLRSDGQAVACGANACGQCDVPPLPEGMAYIHVSAGYRHTLLLRSDGGAAACGWNLDGQCNIPALEAGVSYAPPKSVASLLLGDGWGMPSTTHGTMSSVDEASFDYLEGDRDLPTFQKGSDGNYGDLGAWQAEDDDGKELQNLLWSNFELPGTGKDFGATMDGCTRSRSGGTLSTCTPNESRRLSETPVSVYSGRMEPATPEARRQASNLAGQPAAPSALAARTEPGSRNRSSSREAYVPRGSAVRPRSASREGAAIRARSREALGGSGNIVWTGVNHGRAFTAKKPPEKMPHDHLLEYGGFIGDLNFTRPNLLQGGTFFGSRMPEEQPHNFLQEYGGHADFRDITRPGLRTGGTFMGSNVPEERPHEFLEEYGGFARDSDITRPNLMHGTCVFKTNVPESLPHDQLREYGGRIHDLREVTRPNLQYGSCHFGTNVPQALPHDQLREYGGLIQDLGQITRPGLSHGGMIPVEVKPALGSSGSWCHTPGNLAVQEQRLSAAHLADRARPRSAPRLGGRPKSPTSPGRRSPRKANAGASNMKWLERYKVVEEAIRGHIANWHKTTKTHPALAEGEDEMEESMRHPDFGATSPEAREAETLAN